MKKVNFIASLSPQKQYEIRRWFWATFFLSVCACGIGAYFVVPQLLLYTSLKKEITVLREATKSYGDSVKSKDGLTQEYETLRAREAQINAFMQQKKNPYHHVIVITQACGDGVKLESLRFIKKECEITIVCPTAEHAHVFIKRCNASDKFSHVKMVSLQHDAATKSLRCVIKGNVIF